ncbi:NAD-dependent epimerase/dehydratase family protein [Micromonospora sp. KC207]|uniref:SDR family oxidoreductase n=1 Tax=Micromonospora sp. KC207 TaxID=2530377 RepID=UPI00104E081D|nr:SDR family oxidoreductase [Micromonospora sp. KC207]TDC65366.1 NAD-dependent epimerase/dehydratase family protein [Micromonospora sp. KC207]
MTVLVAGGSGYLGAEVCAALEAAGEQVVALSRTGAAPAGKGLAGDVSRHRFGLAERDWAMLLAETTHVVSAFGSVDWGAGPDDAVNLHAAGVRNVLAFARQAGALAGLVHVSSLLVFGRADGRVGNRELYVGQTFRNWYEYGKYYAETLVREATDVPSTVLRFGPLLGCGRTRPGLDGRAGLLAAVPCLLQGYPVHLARRGDFPSYAGEVTTAAELVVRAVREPATGRTWTWFDPAEPSVAEVFTGVCRPWRRLPRIVDAGPVRVAQRWLGPRVGLPRPLLDYTEPWFDVDRGVLAELPGGAPACPPGYLEATGEALTHHSSRLTGGMR